jgi:hypothetical protein
MVAAPLGLTVGGPLIELAGSTGGLALSGGLTLLLLPIAALAVLGRPPASVTLPHRVSSCSDAGATASVTSGVNR